MVTDPRTSREVGKPANCHLIPDCFHVSDVTVPLDANIDSQIGAKCDVELTKLIRLLFEDVWKGKIALGGGSKSLSCEIVLSDKTFFIPKPKKGSLEEWGSKALGIQDGKVVVEGFSTGRADTFGAYLSMINSAMLVLYHQADQRVYNAMFDQSRRWINNVINGQWVESDSDLLRSMITFSKSIDPKKTEGQVPTRELYRKYYDPLYDRGDGLLDEFPMRCISEHEKYLVVTLPYSRNLRGVVKFRKWSAG